MQIHQHSISDRSLSLEAEQQDKQRKQADIESIESKEDRFEPRYYIRANIRRVQLESQAVLQKHAPEYRLDPVEQAVQELKADVVQEALAHEKWQDIA